MNQDEALLTQLGYKQDLRRAFSRVELFGLSFSIIGVFPSIAYVLLSIAFNSCRAEYTFS